MAPEDSQRPKPSANAKPLPEHLKENDASLDISNRTDGVPEMGDPFHDPNSVQKWAEFNTAPEVTQKIAKVDLTKENQLWYYLGKTSTEARPQYTHDLAIPQHNVKSNFLDSVRPPPPIIPQFQHRSYPASYPLKAAPVSIPPRTPVQHNLKPYQYRPKESMMTTFKAPAYSPDTRKNPNSPVAHQPNVAYDHRTTGPQYGQPIYGTTFHASRPPQGGYMPYAPPHNYTYDWKSQQTPGGAPLLNGIHQFAQSASTNQPPTTQPHQNELPPFPYQQGQGPIHRPAYSPSMAPPASQPQLAARSGAPVSALQGVPTGTSKPSMYATTYSSPTPYSTQSPSSQAEYLTYVTKYPYLKNAFLRRAKTYVSPYSPDGGFTPEWMPKLANSNNDTPNVVAPKIPAGQPSPGLGLTFARGIPSGLPVSRPTPQFQSADAFRQDLNKAPRPPSGPPKWESMFRQLGTSTGSPTTVGIITSTSPLPVLTSALTKSHTPPLPPPSEVQRPIPSPLSDAPNTPKRPDVSPISDDERVAPTSTAPPPPPHSEETWRYTQSTS